MEPTTLLAIKPLHYQGQQLLKGHWLPLVNKLRASLQSLGFEDTDSSESLLLFTFNHPHAALTATATHINAVRRDCERQLNGHALPIQIIIHLPSGEENHSPYRNPEAKLWEMLDAGAIHITKPLKAAWDGLMANKNLPPCLINKHGDGLFTVQMAADESLFAAAILSCRDLSTRGSGSPCFYCGMPSHPPDKCPSKLLTMEHNGLAAVGYLPFEQLDETFRKVFANIPVMSKRLADGVTPSELRKNSGLTVFISFFDINRVYQPRFLAAIAFSRFSKWQSLFKSETPQPDNKNLQLGLDCLRVGKYGQAEEFLMRESQPKSLRRFTATVGMAFVSLEQRGLAAMRTCLELAKSLATQPKEHIYIDLLLSRFYELAGELWKARDIIKNVTTAQVDCPDALYRKLQLEAKDNFSAEACQLLRGLLIDQRQLFMAALIDPTLLPIQTKVEDLLSSQYGTMASSAQDSLNQASIELEGLTLWCEAGDQQILAAQASQETLQQRFQQKSYFATLDVEHKAKTLLTAIRQIREDKLNALYDQIGKAKAQWDEYYSFWTAYRYRLFFKRFQEDLSTLEKPLHEAEELAKTSEGSSYRRAIELLHMAEKALGTLAHTQQRMIWTQLVWDSAVSFSKKLAITEIVGIIMATAAVFGLGQLPEGDTLAALANDPLFQKKATTLTAFLIAPLLALSWTIKSQLKG